MAHRAEARRHYRPLLVFRIWARRVGLDRKLAFLLAGVAVVAGAVTAVFWTRAPGFGPDRDTVVALLIVNGLILLALGFVVGRRLVGLWLDRRRGLAGSGLHVRIVVMFSLVAVTPAVLVAVFSALFLDFGLQAWFSERVRTAIVDSNAVAQAYVDENRKAIRADALSMAAELYRDAPLLVGNPSAFDQWLGSHASARSLSESTVIDSSGRVLVRAPLSLTISSDRVPPEALDRASLGDIVVMTSDAEDRVRALIKLDRMVDAYLLIGRFIDPEVLSHLQRTEVAVNQYQRLEQRQEGILITFVLIFIMVALLLLLAAVWIGFTLATQMSKPISALIRAAERVRRGDLSVQVDLDGAVDEIDTLSRAFNRMTDQLATQREGLIEANRVLDERRRFTEGVLSGVSAGVIGVGADGRIDLPNRSASELLAFDLQTAIGEPLAAVVPEMAPLLGEALARPDRLWQDEVRVIRDGATRTLVVRICAERLQESVSGFIVTFDDVTPLVSAQRKAAWADVARRIAHEIKNPLTPIQLASERLKRKYLPQITTDRESFVNCADTIARHVDDIGRMVDEFSAFARMPRPVIRRENITALVRQTVAFEKNRYPAIRYEVVVPDSPVYLDCDSGQLAQALTNVLKNAAEAIEAREVSTEAPLPPGRVKVEVTHHLPDDGVVEIAVEDNGRGLPAEDRDRLTEPYVTTRAKGTGLGLSIVKKILEDHHGDLTLMEGSDGGARVVMRLPGGAADRVTADAASGDVAGLTGATAQVAVGAPTQIAAGKKTFAHG